MGDLDGCVSAITGAGRGIGAAIGAEVIGEGRQVAIFGMSQQRRILDG
jgi:NAD(P)-dependent dehydrogenase (short-subunit alcohol dehydrogenase family)